jgi:hypothetical protein
MVRLKIFVGASPPVLEDQVNRWLKSRDSSVEIKELVCGESVDPTTHFTNMLLFVLYDTQRSAFRFQRGE